MRGFWKRLWGIDTLASEKAKLRAFVLEIREHCKQPKRLVHLFKERGGTLYYRAIQEDIYMHIADHIQTINQQTTERKGNRRTAKKQNFQNNCPFKQAFQQSRLLASSIGNRKSSQTAPI